MEEEKENNMKRDYDKEPIIIGNNFTSLVFGKQKRGQVIMITQ